MKFWPKDVVTLNSKFDITVCAFMILILQYLSIYLFVNLSIYLSINQSIYIFVLLTIKEYV